MTLTPWIEPTTTRRAPTPALHILINTQHMLTLPTQHRRLIPSCTRPDTGFVVFACVVTSNARVKLVTAKVLDGDDVECRVPMCALGEWCD